MVVSRWVANKNSLTAHDVAAQGRCGAQEARTAKAKAISACLEGAICYKYFDIMA